MQHWISERLCVKQGKRWVTPKVLWPPHHVIACLHSLTHMNTHTGKQEGGSKGVCFLKLTVWVRFASVSTMWRPCSVKIKAYVYSQKVAGRKMIGEGMRPGRRWEDKKRMYTVFMVGWICLYEVRHHVKGTCWLFKSTNLSALKNLITLNKLDS